MITNLTELTEHAPGIALITMKRPDKRNALSIEMMDELIKIFESFAVNKQYRVAILTGDGPAFCSGMDLSQSIDPKLIEPMLQQVVHLLKAIYLCPIPTIAAVQGDAVAGGAGLVAACDFALMNEKAKIGFPEVKRGVVAAHVSALLCRQIAMRDIRELLLLGELIDSKRAIEMRLVNRTVAPEKVLEEALKAAKTICKGAPGAIHLTKVLLENLQPVDFFDSIQKTISIHQTARQSNEAQEGIAAFIEKREPNWVKDL